jgi:hypothetical protein
MGAEVGLLMRPYLPWILLLAAACSETSAVELKESQTSTPPISSTNTPQDPCASLLTFDDCCSIYRCGWISERKDLGFPGVCAWEGYQCSFDEECGPEQECYSISNKSPYAGDCRIEYEPGKGNLNSSGFCWSKPSPP